MSIEMNQAEQPADYASARSLFVEYANQLGVDLGFQNFEHELENLAEIYGGPSGCLFLGRYQGTVVACVGVRRVTSEVCEMKRLYVREDFRGHGLGRRLALASVTAARDRGYRRMLLDTLASMSGARKLYAPLGFRETAPYYPNPLPGVTYMALELS